MAINFDKVPVYIRREIDAPKKVVKQGIRNSTVRRIQEWLNFHECRTVIDGDFGPSTELAVRLFQSQNTLQADAIVGPATWSKLPKAG